MKKILLFITAITILSCNNLDDEIAPSKKESDSLNDFTWKAMNSWYNWQKNVSNLSDAKLNNKVDYKSYLKQFNKPQDLFESLLYKKGEVDRFSWFIEDYEEQQRQFQGISTSFGFKFSPVKVEGTDNIIFYISYVSPKSPANRAGFKRGDIVNAINGTVMTTSNYKALLNNGYYKNITTEFSFVEPDGITLITKKSITKEVVTDNPVYLTKVFEDIGGKKVGYLVYNGFRSSYDVDLNQAFAKLKASNIDELILDLRINGGGSVRTSSYLASMIYQEAGEGKFADLKFNSKHSSSNGTFSFRNDMNIYDSSGAFLRQDPINRISGLSRLYVLTSHKTASASEMIINGLRAYLGESNVITVGTKTYGKNVGSITLYDSPKSDYTSLSSVYINKNHKKAMQPITFQIYNKNGESDYAKGFEPTIKVEEFKSWSNILPFGDENEVILKTALNDIRGIVARPLANANTLSEQVELEINQHNRFDNEMYLESNYFENH